MKTSRRRALLGRLAERRASGTGTRPAVELDEHRGQGSSNASPSKAPSRRLRNLGQRIQGLQESRAVENLASSWSYPQPTGPIVGQTETLPTRVDLDERETASKVRDEDVVLNFENMDKDCGLRPSTTTAPACATWATPSSVHQPSPETCAIHIQFLSATILLNRPFAAYVRQSPKDAAEASSTARKCLLGQTPADSQKLCTTSGIRISKLLLAYRLYHGPEKLFSTINPACLTSAMALISDIVSAGAAADKSDEKKWLMRILETLKEITPTYPVAGRSYTVLCAVASACGLKDVVPVPSQEERSNLGSRDIGPEALGGESMELGEEFIWNLDGPLGLEFYPMLDDLHGIGLGDFYPRLSPWPLPPDPGSFTER